MLAGIAFVNSNEGGPPLNNFNDVVVLRLQVKPGTYVVFGRVVILNQDGDPQNASARVTSKDGSNLIDKVEVRIPGRTTRSSVSLQGTVRVDQTDLVDIRCSTFNGQATNSSLFAIEVSQLNP
jgi:hypothetical protein